MKTNNNPITIFISIISLLLLSLVLMPASAFAMPIIAMGETNFCAGQESSALKVGDKLVALKNKRDQNRNLISSNRTPQSKPEQKLKSIRQLADEKREEHFRQILLKSRTPEQTVAIDSYKSKIVSAISARREGIDRIRIDFKNKITELSDRHILMDKQNDLSLVSRFETLSSEAKISCAAGVDSQIVSEKFSTDIESARAQFRKGVESLSKNKDELDALIISKNQAIDSVLAEYDQKSYDYKGQLLEELSKYN